MADPAASLIQSVADDVWLIPLPLPWPLAVINVYLLKGLDGYLLMDCGLKTDASRQALQNALGELGLGWRDISQIIITHLHPDHFGAAGVVRQLSGAPILMHPLEAKLVAPRHPSQPFFADTERYLRANGVPDEVIGELRQRSQEVAEGSERLAPDGPLEEGDTLPYASGTLQVMVTPGHSPSLLSFYEASSKMLFSTDVIIEKITPNVGVHAFYGGDPLGDYLRSLERLESLEVDLILPSHGDPFRGHRQWIAATREHHRRRSEKIAKAVTGAARHGWTVAGIVWGQDRSPFERRFAMAEALSHLEHLVREQRVTRSTRDGVTYWEGV